MDLVEASIYIIDYEVKANPEMKVQTGSQKVFSEH